MTQSLLQGKRFFCREWAFSKINHCLENRASAKTCGALIMGGPGCGKTALCCELTWPSVASPCRQRTLNKKLLAYHFCQAHDIETLSISAFITNIVDQLKKSELLEGYQELINDPEIRSHLIPNEIERNPDEAFKMTVLTPLSTISPPCQNLIILVDSIDESYLQSISERAQGSRTIAELLSNNHQLFPKWLLLVCSSRKQSKTVTRMFTGFRKISLDDLRKTHVVRDVQQYILFRLDEEDELRQHLSRETAEMLNQLHIKSNGCFLYLEKVLDGVAENFIMLREIREIPGTLNGLYLWLCQRLFVRKQFAKIQPILNVILAARSPLTEDELYQCAFIRNTNLTQEEFDRRIAILSKILNNGKNNTKILFHHSFAEWLLDVKHCTQKYLCNAGEGHGMLALNATQKASQLTPNGIQDLCLHLVRTNFQYPIQQNHLIHWLVMSGANIEDSLSIGLPKDQRVLKLLVEAGAMMPEEEDASAATLKSDVEDVNVRSMVEKLLVETGSAKEGTTTATDCGSTVRSMMEINSANDHTDNYSKKIRGILEEDTPVDEADNYGRTLLHNAAHQGDEQVVKMLLSKNANLEAVDRNGQTALNLAARQGHTRVVEILLKANAKVDHADKDGWTALRSAAWGGHTEVVTLLLEADTEVDHCDSDGRTALRAAAWGGHEDIVRQLLEHGAEVNKADNEGRTALIAAAYMGHVEIVEHLLDKNANINHEDCDGRTALSVASLCIPASQGHENVVSLLLMRNAKVDHRDHDSMTPLLVAAYEGHHDVCELLLEWDADVDHSDNNNRTPLLAAASMGHAKVVRQLLFWNAAVDTIDSEGRTVLSIAAAQGSVEVVGLLLDRGLDEMHRDNAGWTPLHMAAYEGHKEVCDLLKEHGAKVNEVDNDGRHPLILAAQEGHVAVVSTLLDHKATLDHKSHDGKTAFRVACLEGHKDIAHLFLCQGADINYKDADGRSTLYVLALENRIELASFLLDNGADVESVDLEGRSALHVAAWQGHYEMVQLLLNHGANANAVDNDQRTALQSAAWQGHSAVVELLLHRRANVDHTCNQGATALCIASQEGHENVVKILLQYGANANHADQFGRTPIGVALKSGHVGVCKILEDYGAVPANGMKSQSSSSNSSNDTRHSCDASGASLIGANGNLLGSSPSDSSEFTFDRRKSYHSNNSVSSKSLSNVTTSTNQSVQLVNMKGDRECLTFTQQLQQCSMARHRSRPISRILSPVSEPQSPVQSPPISPNCETDNGTRNTNTKLSTGFHTNNLAESDAQSSSTKYTSSYEPNMNNLAHSPIKFSGSKKEKISATINIITNPNAELLSSGDEPVWQINPNFPGLSSSLAKLELQRKCGLPDGASAANFMGQAGLELRSPETRRKRNGIVTNPNYTKGIGVNGHLNKLSDESMDCNAACTGAPCGSSTPSRNATETSSSTGQKGKNAQRPKGLPLKKETPL